MTQFQQLAAVPRITEHWSPCTRRSPAPFRILGFHGQRGVPTTGSRRWNKLHVEETKSRPRRSNATRWWSPRTATSSAGGWGTDIPEHLAPPANAFLATSSPPSSTITGPASSPSRSRSPTGAAAGSTPRMVMTPYEQARIAARSRWLPEAGHHLRATRRRSTCRPTWRPPRKSRARKALFRPSPRREPRGVIRPAAPSAAPLASGVAGSCTPSPSPPQSMPPSTLTFALPLGLFPRPVHAHVRIGKHSSETLPGGWNAGLARDVSGNHRPTDSGAPHGRQAELHTTQSSTPNGLDRKAVNVGHQVRIGPGEKATPRSTIHSDDTSSVGSVGLASRSQGSRPNSCGPRTRSG